MQYRIRLMLRWFGPFFLLAALTSFVLIIGEVWVDRGDCNSSLAARMSRDLYGEWVWHCDVHERNLTISQAFITSLQSEFAPRIRLLVMWCSALAGFGIAYASNRRALAFGCLMFTFPAWIFAYLLAV